MKKIPYKTDQNNPAVKEYVAAVKRGMNHPQSDLDNWEKELAELLCWGREDDKNKWYLSGVYDMGNPYEPTDVIKFIKSLLATQRVQLIEEIETAIKKELPTCRDDWDRETLHRDVVLEYLDSLEEPLSELQEEDK